MNYHKFHRGFGVGMSVISMVCAMQAGAANMQIPTTTPSAHIAQASSDEAFGMGPQELLGTGDKHYFGQNVPVDYAKALHYYQTAALRYHFTASARSRVTPLPFSYIQPRLVCA